VVEANYSGGATNTLTVVPKALTITANDTNKVYGETIVFTGSELTSEGLTNADVVSSVSLSSAGAGAAAEVGVYAITATNAVGSGLGNYAISYVPGTLTVGSPPNRAPVVLNPISNQVATNGVVSRLRRIRSRIRTAIR